MEYRFYQLSKTALPVGAARLAEKAVGRGGDLGMICPNDARLREIDEALWRELEFLPHSIGESDGESHITLSNREALNAGTVFLIDDMDFEGEEGGAELVCAIFHSADADIVNKRRQDWVKWRDSGAFITYWAEEADGKWVKKAQENQPEPSA